MGLQLLHGLPCLAGAFEGTSARSRAARLPRYPLVSVAFGAALPSSSSRARGCSRSRPGAFEVCAGRRAARAGVRLGGQQSEHRTEESGATS